MNHLEISSVHNPKVKEWSLLRQKKGRDQQGKFLVEGIRIVIEALEAGADVEVIIYDQEKGLTSDVTSALKTEIPILAASTHVFAKLTETEQPQGILAVIRKPGHSMDIVSSTDTLWVALDGVQDPGNLGTIIRSADAVGANGVLLGSGTVDPYNSKVVRSTMGSLFHLPVIEGDLIEWLPRLKNRQIQIIGAGLGGESSCYDAVLSEPICIVMGNEAKGLSTGVRKLLDQEVFIPMPGRAESLNVAMAATVLFFEAMRQRMMKNPKK
jgi:TrmH family RNA methyltransferase